MPVVSTRALTDAALEEGHGILRLAPTWVPRAFCVPGRRIKLHPDDYYALGGERGGIDERWFSSTIRADNGPLTGEHEGLSAVVTGDGDTVLLLRDAVDEAKGELIGDDLWRDHGCWPMYSKFFDNQGPLPLHIHQRDVHAAHSGRRGKPEAYYFPRQLNNHGGDFPHTFFGLNPGTSRDAVADCLQRFGAGDNKITALSAAYRLEPGTGWDVPAGILHAPGSLCTYEPQRASDVFAMYESYSGGRVLSSDLLWKDSPPDRVGDIDYLIEVIDWEANVDPDFAANHFMEPLPAHEPEEMTASGYVERWICYRSGDFSAKELTALPGRTVTVRDAGAYGTVVVQGRGAIGPWTAEAPTLIRFGQLTSDEFFVSARSADEGVTIVNTSATEPMVMLKHFGPGNPDLDLDRTKRS